MGRFRHPVMGAAEIADRLGVTRQRVYQIVGKKGFPDPIVQLAMGQVFWTKDIEQWIAENRPELNEDDQP